MALPTAPLGQLPNMNMPFQMPTYEKRRGRDQILTALAAGIAQQLGGQVVDNAMSRDYAEEPAGFWGKLVSGPKENRAQNEAKKERLSKAEQAEADRTNRILVQDLDIAQKDRTNLSRVEQETAERNLRAELAAKQMLQQRTMFDLEHAQRPEMQRSAHEAQLAQIDRQAGHAGTQRQTETAAQQAFQREMLVLQNKQEIQKLEVQAKLRAGSPEAEYYLEQARGLRMQNDMLSGRLGLGSTTADLRRAEVRESLTADRPASEQVRKAQILNQVAQAGSAPRKSPGISDVLMTPPASMIMNFIRNVTRPEAQLPDMSAYSDPTQTSVTSDEPTSLPPEVVAAASPTPYQPPFTLSGGTGSIPRQGPDALARHLQELFNQLQNGQANPQYWNPGNK